MMPLCMICDSAPARARQLCDGCQDTIFFLETIRDDYLSGVNASQAVTGALGEFSWVYQAYPTVWGYYNSMVQAIFQFILEESTEISEAAMDFFDFTRLNRDDIIELMEEAGIIVVRRGSPGVFDIGPVARFLVPRIIDDIKNGSGPLREHLIQLFGITSIVLSLVLLKRKVNGREHAPVPKKFLSLFLSFVEIINDNMSGPDSIPSIITTEKFQSIQRKLNLPRSTQKRFLFEMFGLTFHTPGRPNIIARMDPATNELVLKPEVINLLEFLRERKRDRERER